MSIPRIVILGGGFGGLYTALELSRKPWTHPPEITLVDRQDRFVFLPLLYELLTEELEDWEIAPRFEDLLATPTPQAIDPFPLFTDQKTLSPPCPVLFQQGNVEAIDLEARTIRLDNDRVLDYNTLVLALGGETPLDRVPGAAEYAFPFRQLADVRRLKAALNTWEQKSTRDPIRLAIAGGGASGVELACKLADRLGSRAQIRLIDSGSELLSSFSQTSREAATAALAERQITIQLNTKVLAIQADSIQFQIQNRDLIEVEPMDGVIWTVGVQVVPLIRDLPLAKAQRHQLHVTSTLQTSDRPEIFAIGDLAAVIDADGQAVPATAQAAFQQASYCAWNVWAYTTQDRPLLPFHYQGLGEMLSLGIDTAVLSGLGLTLTGPLGYLARRAIYLARMPTLDHQLRVGWNWMSKPIAQELQRWFPQT